MGITNFDMVQANKFIGPAGLNTQGNVYYVNPRLGNNANSGTSPVVASGVQVRSRNDGPLATVAAAYAKCTAGQNDIVVLEAAGNTSANTTDYWSATLTWAKNNTHLVGWSSDSMVSQRARVSTLSTATAANVTSMLNVTASGCIFKGIQIYHGLADSGATGPCVIVSGSRNRFENVHIAGMGDSNMVGAGGASLKLNGGSENVFKDCVIGLDTVAAANLSNGEIWFDGDASRNWFEDCLIQRFISNAGYVHLKVQDATGIDRWQIFKNCLFLSESANDATAQTGIMTIPAMTQGYIILQNSYYSCPGASTVWDANARTRIRNNSVAAAASGAGGEMTIL